MAEYNDQDRVELDHVEGDLDLKNCRYIIPQQGDSITVTGAVRVWGGAIFEGSLKARSLECKTRDDIEVLGDLTVESDASVKKGSLRVDGNATGRMI
jgi:hypothetical protein